MILFQHGAIVSKVETEREEIRDEHYKVTGHKTVRTVTVSIPGERSYNTKQLEFEHDSLQVGDELRVIVTNQPAVTEADIAESKVTAIDQQV